MKWCKILALINIIFPLVGLGLMIFYEICDTSCSYLTGTFLGINLKYVGIIFMASLLVMAFPPVSRFDLPVSHLRTVMLSSAVGGEILLVRFQVIHDTYCQFCLAFGLCVVVLFAANFQRENKILTSVSFLGGIVAFLFFFEGAILPLYSF